MKVSKAHQSFRQSISQNTKFLEPVSRTDETNSFHLHIFCMLLASFQQVLEQTITKSYQTYLF